MDVCLSSWDVAAGISSAFNAPIAGIFFALEIILARFTYHSFGLIVLSSVTSCVITRLLVGDLAEFSVPIYILQNSWEMILCLGLGLVSALVGVTFTRSLAISEKMFSHIKCPIWFKPAVGGLLCGAIAIFYPQIMASGYDVMNEAMNSHLAITLMLALVIAKIIGTSFILGSGGAGGDLAPSLFIGCMLGGVYGCVVNYIFPGSTAATGAYALIGMATVFAAAARAPLTAVFMIFETTANYYMLMPILAASVVAALFASVLDKELGGGTIHACSHRNRRLQNDDFSKSRFEQELFDLIFFSVGQATRNACNRLDWLAINYTIWNNFTQKFFEHHHKSVLVQNDSALDWKNKLLFFRWSVFQSCSTTFDQTKFAPCAF